MTTLRIVGGMNFLSTVGVLAIAVALSGCPSANEESAEQSHVRQDAVSTAKAAAEPQPESSPKAEQQPAARSKAAAEPESPEKDLSEELEEVQKKPRDLGPPLVDNPDKLVRLAQDQPVWVDRQNKHVVLQGEVCKAGYPLEFFATYSNRSYEAVVAVNVKPSIVHAGLLAVGAEPGHPARFQPEFVPPEGTEVAIEVRWKDDQGKVQSAPAQHWIRNIQTKKALESNWVFGGSQFVTDDATGKKYYLADSGELICVLSLPTAMLDLPIRGYGAIEARSFEAFEEHLPPSGTPTTILLKPIPSTKPAADAKPAAKKPTAIEAHRAEAKRQAVESARPWLELVDRGEYSRSWETAAEHFKNVVDQRAFVKSVSGVRKPLGKVMFRQLVSKQYTTHLPKAPYGEYVVIRYQTTFENRPSAIETVTPMLEKDKKWRVSGYTIR